MDGGESHRPHRLNNKKKSIEKLEKVVLTGGLVLVLKNSPPQTVAELIAAIKTNAQCLVQLSDRLKVWQGEKLMSHVLGMSYANIGNNCCMKKTG